jgi:alkanesulfonate monooxygenase
MSGSSGKPLEQVSKLIGDVAARQRVGPPVHFGLSAFVIARDTDEEAAEELAYLFELAEADKPEVDHLLSSADPNAVMFQTHARHLAVGTNGGTAAGLVGSYDTVARRIGEFHDAGIETFMLQFQPFEPEMRRFAHEVAPRARRLALLAS